MAERLTLSKPPQGLAYYQSLKVLAAAETIYSGLPNASVSLSVAVLQPLCTAKWALSWLKLKKEQPLTRRESFACITLFDTSRLDLQPDIFEKVMAVTSANSIYVASALLDDPWQRQEGSSIKPLVGAVGKPGLSFLVAPPKPNILPPKLANWRQ